jgi:gliding motility-associated-like protein
VRFPYISLIVSSGSLSNRLCRALILFSFLILNVRGAYSQNYVFAQLSGTPMNTNGWNLQGDARVTNVLGTADSELLICPNVLMSSGAVFYNQPINLSLCDKWIAEFDFRMFDGNGADGIAFCFLDVPPVGFVNGGGLGIPAAANGLKVCFDTWNNCIPFDTSTVHQDMPKIEIRWGIGYDDNSNPNNPINGECLSEPTRDNSDGKISFIRSSNYNHAKITYDSGNIQVYVNDTLYLTGFRQFNFTGYLGFTASTGGYRDNHSIKNVTIYTQMPPSFAGNSLSFCPYDTVQLGGPSNPQYAYSWYPSAGLSDSTVSAPFLHISNDSADSQTHMYYVRTSYSSRVGCSSVDSVIVNLYPNPKLRFLTPGICLTDAVAQFQDSSYTKDISTLPFTYWWNFGDPNAQPGNPDNSSAQNPAHHYSAASNYQVSLTVTNSEGCADSLSEKFTVNGAFPRADFSIDHPSSLCSNQPVQISNLSTVDFGSIIRVQIFWGDTTGVSYTDSLPYPGKKYTHNYPNPISAGASTYNLQMIAASGITCGNEMDQAISVQPAPHVHFAAIPTICLDAPPLTVAEASELTGMSGSFSFSGRGISPAGLLNPQAAGAGTDTLLYSFMSSDGCKDSAFQTVWIQSLPSVSAGNDTLVVIGQPLQLHASSSDPSGDSFSWTPISGLNDPGIQNPVANLIAGTDTIRYLVQATDSAGCTGQASILVEVFKTQPDIFVPNAFTPGKGINNLFRPIPVGISSLQYFRIYNRWGQLVFGTSRMGDGWDGNLEGNPQGTGSYVWTVQGTTYTGKVIARKGTMTLIR